MNLESVCVIGGSGFVGRHVVHRLARERIRVRVPTRHRESVKDELILLPTVEVLDANVHDPATLDRLVAGCDAIIHLVGILHATRDAGFERVHTELPRRVLEACQRNGVRRYVHMSALHASPDGPSAYLRSKGEAEKLVRASGLDWTIFRPSVIFGRGDSFLTMFASTLRLAPALPLACPNARFQPVWVEDVARAFVDCLGDSRTFGQSYDLCGPRVYTLRELVEYVGRVIGKPRPVVGLNDRLSYLQARMMEFSPIKVMTRDNYYSMKIDSVCACPFPEVLGFQPTAMEAVVPEYLGGQTPRARYKEFRDRAGR